MRQSSALCTLPGSQGTAPFIPSHIRWHETWVRDAGVAVVGVARTRKEVTLELTDKLGRFNERDPSNPQRYSLNEHDTVDSDESSCKGCAIAERPSCDHNSAP